MIAGSGAIEDVPALALCRGAEQVDLGLFFIDRQGRAAYQDRTFRARHLASDPIAGRFGAQPPAIFSHRV